MGGKIIVNLCAELFVGNRRGDIFVIVKEVGTAYPHVVFGQNILWREQYEVTFEGWQLVLASLPRLSSIVEANSGHGEHSPVAGGHILHRELLGKFKKELFDKIRGKVADVVSAYSLGD